jgi:hypothetical protein
VWSLISCVDHCRRMCALGGWRAGGTARAGVVRLGGGSDGDGYAGRHEPGLRGDHCFEWLPGSVRALGVRVVIWEGSLPVFLDRLVCGHVGMSWWEGVCPRTDSRAPRRLATKSIDQAKARRAKHGPSHRRTRVTYAAQGERSREPLAAEGASLPLPTHRMLLRR